MFDKLKFNLKTREFRIALLLALFAIFVIAAVWRFSPLMPHAFFGDDLSYFLSFKDGQCGTHFSQLLTTVCTDKYRPLPAGFVLILFHLFDTAVSHYMAINVCLQAASAILVFAIAHRLSKGNYIVSLSIAFAVVTSRFAAYQVTQVIGPVEGLALPIFLAAIYSVIHADQSNENVFRWGWLAVFLSFLLVHNHERYIVVPVWLGLVFIILPNFQALPIRKLALLVLACIFVPAFYITYKIAFLQSPFMVGTGGSHLGFDLERILVHVREAMLSILGFNEGPEYLVGVRLKSLPWYPSGYMAGFASVACATLISLGLWKSLTSRNMSKSILISIRWPILLIILTGFLLVPAISTIRLEQRWLFSPFILMLLLCAWSSGQVTARNKLIASALVSIVSVSYISLDSVIVKHFNNVFFVYSARFADIVKRDIADKYPGQSLPLRLLSNPDHCEWTLIKGGFFRVYGGRERDVKCINQNDIVENTLADNSARIFAEQPQGFLVDITDYWNTYTKSKQRHVLFDFIKNFSDGIINDPVHVSTPSGKGALILPVSTPLGSINTLTVISGFSYKYSNVYIEKGAVMNFGLGMIYPADAMSATVEIIGNSNSRQSIHFQQNVESPSVGGPLVSMPVTIPLTRFEGGRVSIVFSATNAGGSPGGQWLAFSDPTISTLTKH